MSEQSQVVHTSNRTYNIGSIEFPFQPPATDGDVVEVSPGVLWVRLPMPMKLDHINVYLLRDHDGWYLVDTGLNTSETKNLWNFITAQQLDGLPIKALICTHFHYDHTGLAQWITEQYSVPLYMTYGEYFTFRSLAEPITDADQPGMHSFYTRAGLDDSKINKIVNALKSDPFMSSPPKSFRRLSSDQVLNIGGRQWSILIGEGHSPEHACLYCAEDEILIAGDQLLPRITSNILVNSFEPEANPLQLWFNSLDKLDTLSPNTLVLPSHQDVFRGLHKRVDELRIHHEKSFSTIRKFLANGISSTAVQCMQALYLRELKGGELLLGLGETLAHLSWMLYEGEVEKVLDSQGIYQFKLSTTALEQTTE